MYVVRAVDGSAEQVSVFVEDPAAPAATSAKGKGKAEATDDDDLMILEPGAKQETDDTPSHTRWTYSSIALPPSFSSPNSPSVSTVFDTFIQRALFAPAQPGAPAGQRDSSYWQPRGQYIAIEGYTFSVGETAGSAGEWEVKVGSVLLKGGTAGGTTKGCVVEATYLPVPYMPANSSFIKDFLLSLFPPAAVQNNEIEFLELTEDDFDEAGMLDLPDASKGEEPGEWEWQDKHSTYALVWQFKNEGLL
ncbi:pyruvate dehydrogenase kinase [Rhodotorula toruloides]|uniref:Pyruvate dehydrogenase kinase n=1 Tax=Rhodotorula toruloides TaxID=5286 RepID=A0A511K7C5_RHOTO|nr:pyruvate dehydrogenase kinase [Rhodotorula toruloides]